MEFWHRLLEMFIARAPSVLFATASFWEGVDVPGDPLRLVLIDRLPFDPPADPLIAARAERLGDEAFERLQLPRAILRLSQGFGRLVRTRTDRGVVAILDRRVRTRAYGRAFLDALPDAHRVEDLGDLERWWCGSGSHR
jgi:ATP-dependent DNA helicase DinG